MIIIEPYNPEWEEHFLKFKAIYEKLLNGLYLDILHIGSTSVKGLCAKPIIDIDIVIDNNNILKKVIKKLGSISYEYEGEKGIKDRHAFRYIGDLNLYPHHLYVCLKNCDNLKNHIDFRDYLRDNELAKKEYSKLKIKLSNIYKNDREAYTEAKTDFIQKILREVRK